MTFWYLLDSGVGEPALNMAMDAALLEAMPRIGRPVLRFYGWTELAASFGYFQAYADVARTTSLRPLIRRPTAGGIVPHDADWTYSLALPPADEWYSLTAVESYRRVHEWLRAAFGALGIETELASGRLKTEEGQCFAGHEKFDLLWRGRKIAGAAQRRRKDGLLIQGSVQPPLPELTRLNWQEAMREAPDSGPRGHWEEWEADGQIGERARELAEKKYSREDYNRKR